MSDEPGGDHGPDVGWHPSVPVPMVDYGECGGVDGATVYVYGGEAELRYYAD